MSTLLSSPDALIQSMHDLPLGRPVLAYRRTRPLCMVVRAVYRDDAKRPTDQLTAMLRTSDGPAGAILFVDWTALHGLHLRTVACQWCPDELPTAADLLSDNGVPVCAHHGRATRSPAPVWSDDAVATELHRLGLHQ